MKSLSFTTKFLAVLMICFSFGCSESDTSGSSNSGYGGGGTPGGGNPGSGSGSGKNGKSCESYTPIAGATDSSRRHIYLGEFRLDFNSGPQGVYRSFIDDFGLFCMNNQGGFKWQPNPYTGKLEYAFYWARGIANCSHWDDFFKLWIMFPKNNPSRAHLIVDATMSGYSDGRYGQGYDVQTMSLPDAQIDCREKDKIVIYYEPQYGFQFKVNIYQGDKNSERLRAEVFYKNASIGKSDFFIK